MVKRFRMIAGPNGSGKSTLVKRLRDDYSVNFYSFVNADDIFALVAKTGAYSPKFPVFDNSGAEMLFLGEYDRESGWIFSRALDELPSWFVQSL